LFCGVVGGGGGGGGGPPPAPHLRENDTGPDDANHAPDGVIVWDPGAKWTPRREERYSIYDVAPSVLRFFGMEVPEDMIGRTII
jgi:predicted AlkP superfamily phosphohydrolase/phosphomutase